MTMPRSKLIDAECAHYYHCVSRCVRRAYLCGKDAATGYDFSHRRAWIEDRLQKLATIFALDLCAYAVMSNHYHVVLHLDLMQPQTWSNAEIIERWQQIYRLPKGFSKFDAVHRSQLVSLWRDRLGSISWFMKCVNEPLARAANKEDGCKGRFWEGRFRSQAILDNDSVLKCMAYVDLNPLRAKIVTRPENAKYTSLRARVTGRDIALASMATAPQPGEFSLPVTLPDYLRLVDFTGRQIRRGKRGKISGDSPSIIKRLQDRGHRNWLDEMVNLSRLYSRAIGSVASLRLYRDYHGQQRLNGLVS